MNPFGVAVQIDVGRAGTYVGLVESVRRIGVGARVALSHPVSST